MSLVYRSGRYLAIDCPRCEQEVKCYRRGKGWHLECSGGHSHDELKALLTPVLVAELEWWNANGRTESASPPPQDDGPAEGAHTIPYSAIESAPVKWLRPCVPLGMLMLLAGDPGLGKSLLTCQWAADESRAGGPVLPATAEDSPAITVRPRLEAAGADLGQVHDIALRRDGVDEGIALPDDIAELDRLVQVKGARLVVIDPLMAHLPERVNSWRDQSVRSALAPLYRLAHCAVVVIVHLNKARGADPLHRVGGSIGIPGAVRSALLLARDPEDPDGERDARRVLAHVKCNVAALAPSLSYEIEPFLLTGEQEIETARMRLIGESNCSGHELLDGEADLSALDEAINVLSAELANGAQDARRVKDTVKAVAGVSERTVATAKKELGVEAVRVGEAGRRGGGRWMWRLPPVKAAEASESIKAANSDCTQNKAASPISGSCTLNDISHSKAEGALQPKDPPALRLQAKTDNTLNQPHRPRCSCFRPGKVTVEGQCQRCYGWLTDSTVGTNTNGAAPLTRPAPHTGGTTPVPHIRKHNRQDGA